MWEFLDQIDKELLLALNNSYPAVLNNIMFWISNKLVWIPFYSTIIYLSIYYWKKDAWIVVLTLALSILFADQIASGFFKNWVQRPRPTHDLQIAHLVITVKGYTGGKYGFVSSHASNSFVLAALSSFLFRNRMYTISAFVWVIIVSYSRIYLGVHYVGDIIGGMIVGAFVAFVLYWIIRKFSLLDKRQVTSKLAFIPLITLLLTFLSIIVYSMITI